MDKMMLDFLVSSLGDRGSMVRHLQAVAPGSAHRALRAPLDILWMRLRLHHLGAGAEEEGSSNTRTQRASMDSGSGKSDSTAMLLLVGALASHRGGSVLAEAPRLLCR